MENHEIKSAGHEKTPQELSYEGFLEILRGERERVKDNLYVKDLLEEIKQLRKEQGKLEFQIKFYLRALDAGIAANLSRDEQKKLGNEAKDNFVKIEEIKTKKAEVDAKLHKAYDLIRSVISGAAKKVK